MKLLLDEMHAAAIAALLRDQGVDAVAVTERPDLRGTDDETLLGWAASQGRVLVTENVRDLAPIAARWAQQRRDHAGIAFTSPTRFHRGSHAYIGDATAALAALSGSGWPTGLSEITWL